MIQTDLPLTVSQEIEKIFTQIPFIKNSKPEAIYIEKLKKNISDYNYYINENFLTNKAIIDSSEYKRMYNLFPAITSYRPELEKFLYNKGFEIIENRTSGCFYYPPDGFMSWHTNYKRQDWRIYIVKSLHGDSFFRYTEQDNMITEYDPQGYSYRIFYVGDEARPFWHCVYGGSGRYSIGFRLMKI